MIRHTKILGRGDSASDVVRASRWNAEHASPDWMILHVGFIDVGEELNTTPDFIEIGGNVQGVYTAPDAYVGAYRTMFDCSYIDQVRLELYTQLDQPTLEGEFRAQYSTDRGVSWNYFDGVAGPRVAASYVISGNGPGVIRGEWVNIGAAAQTEVLVRLGSLLGDLQLMPCAITLWGR